MNFTDIMNWNTVVGAVTEVTNISPCDVDVVGDATFPALSLFDDCTYLYFRMRLDCDPLSSGGQKVWGVVIKDENGDPVYTVRVAASGAEFGDKIEIFEATEEKPFETQVEESGCNPDIDLADDGNVFIELADSMFNDDDDYFLYFKVLKSCLAGEDFTEPHIFCVFTSANENNINKETPPPYEDEPGTVNPSLCGNAFPPPPSRGIKIIKL